jgi:DNA-binding transcriptional LysR family regulator
MPEDTESVVMAHNPSHPAKGAKQIRALKLLSVTQALLVSECLSFRRAAKVLGIRQSAVSRRVRALEDELGVSLFERHRAGVRLTNAGARFLVEARQAMEQLNQAVETAAAAGTGAVGRLSIGFLSSISTGYLRELIKAYRRLHPDVSMHILEGASADNVSALLKRELDVGFIMDTSPAEGCDVLPLWSERIFVALPKGHALGAKPDIRWPDLRGENIILRQSEGDAILCERVATWLTVEGHVATIERLDVGRESQMNLVAIGLGLALTCESTIAGAFPNIDFRPMAGEREVIRYCAAWLPQNDNPALRRFLSLARRVARDKARLKGH